MDILVFAKQIPDVNKIEFDESTKRIRREGVELKMNSFDKRAIEEGLRIKEKVGGSVSVATMGPSSAEQILHEALSMGVDNCYLITDRIFAGADTLVTSKVLAKLASSLNPELVLMGKYSLDGETSQVPPQVAQLLGLPFKSSVSRIEVSGDTATIEAEDEEGLYDYRIPLPAVMSVSEKINRARGPVVDVPEAGTRIRRLSESDLKSGTRGEESPTVVEDIIRLTGGRTAQFLPLNDDSLTIIEGLAEGKEDAVTEIRAEPFRGDAKGEIWGVGLKDRQVTVEIATKISGISQREGLRVTMVGNITPKDLEGMPCLEYLHIDTSDNIAFLNALQDLVLERSPEFLIFPSTVDGREIASSLAARLQVGLTADCIDVDVENGKLVQQKPAFGGGVVARILSKSSPQMATVRPGMFKAGISAESFSVKTVQPGTPSRLSLLSSTKKPVEFKSILSAKIVIGVGRGIRRKEDMQPVMELASMLKAAVGGTRPVVDAGILPRQQQIGLTGYSISPDLYIALGVSGRANHVVGTRYAKKIVAVNKDPEAPIFKYADYAIVADIFDFVRSYMNHLESGSASHAPGSQ